MEPRQLETKTIRRDRRGKRDLDRPRRGKSLFTSFTNSVAPTRWFSGHLMVNRGTFGSAFRLIRFGRLLGVNWGGRAVRPMPDRSQTRFPRRPLRPLRRSSQSTRRESSSFSSWGDKRGRPWTSRTPRGWQPLARHGDGPIFGGGLSATAGAVRPFALAVSSARNPSPSPSLGVASLSWSGGAAPAMATALTIFVAEETFDAGPAGGSSHGVPRGPWQFDFRGRRAKESPLPRSRATRSWRPQSDWGLRGGRHDNRRGTLGAFNRTSGVFVADLVLRLA